MPSYLLDNNHVEALFRNDPRVMRHVNAHRPEDWKYTSTITLGEIEAGHRMTQTTDQARRDEYTAYINEHFRPYAFEVSDSTGFYYAQIIERIWQLHPPPNPNKRTELHLVELGVDINDVWAVAIAWERGLVFVTRDNMACIREAVGARVLFETWLEDPEEG